MEWIPAWFRMADSMDCMQNKEKLGWCQPLAPDSDLAQIEMITSTQAPQVIPSILNSERASTSLDI